MSFKLNPLHAVDSYKTSHHKMYAEGTEYIYSNFTPRTDRLFNAPKGYYDGRLVFFGLQGALRDMKEIWHEEFFNKPKEEVCAEYLRRLAPFAGGMELDISHVEKLHDIGHLPIQVMALKEGSKVPMGVPIFTVMNTKKDAYWITNYLETWLSNELWKPSTIATIAKVYRNILEDFATKTGSPMEFVDWQAHDFSCRGMSGMMDAAKSSAGHLVSFLGTDTISAVDYVEWAYDGKMTFVGGSVPASEHSVMTLDGTEGEYELFKRLITKVVPTGVVSLVSDGYDYWKVLTEYLPALKGDIMSRQQDAMGFAKVVVRPDSGDPADIVCGTVKHSFTTMEEAIAAINEQHLDEASEACEGSHCIGDDSYTTVAVVDGIYYEFTTPMDYNRHDKKYYYVDNYGGFFGKTTVTECATVTPEMKGSIQILWETFGGTITETGHKLLDSHIGLIYGDSITMDRMVDILTRLEAKGFASGNMVFGIGSYTYQYVTRDTFGFAMKATWAQVNGEPRNIFKAPKTDKGGKHSAKGRLAVIDVGGTLTLLQEVSGLVKDDLLELTFVNGQLARHQTIEEIRAIAKG